MKHIHYLYIAALAFLIACSSEERIVTTDSNEEPSEPSVPIELSAGIVEGSSKATTRTDPTYQALTQYTKLALQVNGNWKHGDTTTPITKTTTATIGTASETNNVVNFTAAETLYWDDYGTADPDNATVGRTEGLTIYGVAIDNKTTAPTVSDWSALSWEVPTNQTTSGSTPADKDLLISNNVKTGTSDGTYKFTEKTSGKLLKFTHALSKITVVMTANAGFVDKNSDDLVDFANDPEVLLTSNVANSHTNTEWACTKGNVNITTGEVTLTGTSSSGDPSVITMWQASSTGHVVTKEALVMPGSQFSDDNAIIARINADGNIYYVTAEKIRAKIAGDSKVTEAGKNYIINVIVDKTGISHVSATVANWTDVTADEVAPKINVTADWGSGTGTMTNAFSFYRSTSLGTGYGTVENTSYYKSNSEVTYSEAWSMSPTLYWPDHNTHYQFRAVCPATVTTTGDGTEGDGILASPRVITANGSQVIKVKNEAYLSGYSSNLMIARPEIAESEQCNNSDHTPQYLYSDGICATEGTIKLNFRYMMSQVEVNLSTTETTNQVNLTSAKVELVNVYDHGNVKLGDRTVDFTGYSRGDYTLHATSTSTQRLDAVIPQTFSSTKFKITIFKSGDPEQGVDDIYYADISDFTPGGWTAGNHYVYNLTVTKTEVQVSATLTDWTTVTSSQNIWF